MLPAALRYGIPDIVLPRVGGGVINPSAFIGHELVVFFCPSEPVAAATEIESYRRLLSGFEDAGAWLMAILTGGRAGDESGIAVAMDDDGAAWRAFAGLAEDDAPIGGESVGAFLFGRGGCLIRAWPGAGHALEVLGALRERA